jgi:hypothetical protein
MSIVKVCRLIFLGVLMVFNLACSVFGIRTEETPPYKVLHQEKNFEIREYASVLVARTSNVGEMEDVQNQSFRILAKYIFGGNERSESISMTAPVLQESKSESIAMTAPVIQQQSGERWIMEFVLPSKYSLSTAPKPKDSRVEILEKSSEIVASLRFTWGYSQSKIERKTAELRGWLKKFPQYEVVGSVRLAAYDPPFTIPFLRKNEVHLLLNIKP